MPWTSIFLASLEVDGFDGDIKSRVLRAIHDGPNGLKSKDFSDVTEGFSTLKRI